MAKTMVFIDSRVNDLDVLVSQFEAGTEYKVLYAAHDGLLQIEESLSGKSDYSSIRIISHGSPGAITIGSTLLNSDNLLPYQLQLANIGHSLTESGDLLLYGCNVGAGASGQQFIETLAQLTGADVAASDDVTGGVEIGGDWQLEVTSGSIKSKTPFVNATPLHYDYTLSNYANDYILAQLSNLELTDKGWSILERDYNNQDGYSATAFKNDDDGSIVIAYRGTQPAESGDIKADVAIAGLDTALNKALAVCRTFPQEKYL